jgi:hypothetical protein
MNEQVFNYTTTTKPFSLKQVGYARDETCQKRRGKMKDDKNKNKFNKRRKDNKTLRQKKRKGAEKKL